MKIETVHAFAKACEDARYAVLAARPYAMTRVMSAAVIEEYEAMQGLEGTTQETLDAMGAYHAIIKARVALSPAQFPRVCRALDDARDEAASEYAAAIVRAYYGLGVARPDFPLDESSEDMDAGALETPPAPVQTPASPAGPQ